MKKLLILDSNSILNRAFYGVRYLSAKDGTPTNAIYGFLNILLKLIKEQEPDYICAAFDVKAPTFRHKQYEGYKAQRKPMPEGLAAQMPLAKDVLRAMGVTILEKEGYEADDIIGTVARLCEESEISCFIATGDKDDLQLASDKTKVILTVTKSGYNETIIYDDKAVKEKYHVTSTEFIDVKALMGDPSDNIPGVKGVGEKTAMSLIEKHHSIEYIYENIDDIGLKGAMLQKMKDGREMAFMSKELATINRNTPIEFNAEECVFDGFENNGELYEILKRLELNSIIKKLDLSGGDNVKENEDIFKDFSYQVGDKNMISGDKVTVVLDFDGDNISSAAVGAGNNAVVLNEQDDIKELLEDDSIAKVMFDVKEAIVKLNGRIDIKNISDDTAIAAYLVDPAKNEYTIEKLASEYFGTVIEKPEVKQLSLLDDVETDRSEYLAKCAVALGVLNERIGDKIKENGQEKLYHEVELPLVTVLAHLEINGFLVDDNQLKEFADKLGEKIDALTNEIYMLAGEEFNINSPKQLGVILFEKLELKPVKKTKTGYATNADVLEKLRDKHPIVNFIMEYRQLAKLKSTYCDGLRAVVNPNTHRIHSVFTQTVTVTGRLSSTEPNLQNIPTRTELGREIRKMFVAKEDYVLVDADYSQIELRVLAHIANDETMINAFRNNEDIHAVTASQVLGIPLEDVTKEQRSSAKAVNFGIVYGIGEFSLAQDLHISVKEAKAYIESYLEKYHGVRNYMESIKEQAKKDGYVKTMLNRIRYIPELKSPNYNIRQFGERVALNTPIQGTAADIIKLAMVRVDNRLINEGLKSKLILQVHDELIVEAHKDEVDKVKQILSEEMQSAMELNVPLKVDMSTGHSWYDAK
ncbi:MAG: DNA polymerase I [Hominilimicola sp.]|uniref:DNA polymerase I n=1 Tax=Hominilimicola sp. TaxID=3073571 RepID=UPI00399BDD56